mmetsp:Transcript_104488/g.300737  ORF Transcript_104488/g.300737 Transcript_104488/m.300737 type:complete len:229 (-) Transcript_104488:860-1546(-)
MVPFSAQQGDAFETMPKDPALSRQRSKAEALLRVGARSARGMRAGSAIKKRTMPARRTPRPTSGLATAHPLAHGLSSPNRGWRRPRRSGTCFAAVGRSASRPTGPSGADDATHQAVRRRSGRPRARRPQAPRPSHILHSSQAFKPRAGVKMWFQMKQPTQKPHAASSHVANQHENKAMRKSKVTWNKFAVTHTEASPRPTNHEKRLGFAGFQSTCKRNACAMRLATRP